MTKHTKRNETKHIKITQNQCSDKAVDVSVVIQEQDLSDSNYAQQELGKETR